MPINNPSTSQLWEAIKIARKASGFTIAEMANRAHISASHLYSLERGKTTEPSLRTISNLSRVVNASIEWLMILATEGLEKYIEKYHPDLPFKIQEVWTDALLAAILKARQEIRWVHI